MVPQEKCMSVIYSDAVIEELLLEPKTLPENWQSFLSLRAKRGHDERQLALPGDAGNYFLMIFRRSRFQVLDFSIILAV